MKLIQLSDLHIGGAYFNQGIFDTIVDEVNNKLRPDAVLITGDLTDDGLVSQFERARTEINKLVDSCPNILILPGNHDYRHTGYLLFKKFFPSFMRESHDMRFGYFLYYNFNLALGSLSLVDKFLEICILPLETLSSSIQQYCVRRQPS